jgi:predicted dehydrogenase
VKRRTFVSLVAQAAAAPAVLPTFAIGRPGPSANSRLNIAFIGSGGWIARQPYEQGCREENLVAFCDVDRDHCAENMRSWRTTQPFFEDFRVMLDKMHKEIDAVVISTPDHTHFPATLAAMERGLHVYTQKPLTHNVWQARTLARARERYRVVTQMGNQGHAGASIRKSYEAYRAGAIGEVSEVFAHNGGPQLGGEHFANPPTMPPPSSPVPAGLAWDLWLGPAAKRDFYRDYLPYKWRAFYDFGSGILADWGCHTFDTPVWVLDLDPPTVVECLERKPSLDGVVPAGSRIRFEFPANAKRGPVVLHWFDGPQDWSKVGRIDRFGAEHAAQPGPGLLDGRHQGDDRLRHPCGRIDDSARRTAHRAAGQAAAGTRAPRRGRPVPGVDQRHQADRAGAGLEFRVRGPLDRDHPARGAGPALSYAHRVGCRGRPHHQSPGAQRLRQGAGPRGLGLRREPVMLIHHGGGY